jgi:hypothetical protein
MEVIQVSDRPASQSFYEVAGRLLFIESLDIRLVKLIEQLFSGWQLAPVSFPGRAADIRVQFFCGALPEIPQNLNRFEIAEGGQCYTDGADYYLALGNAMVHVQNGSAAVWIHELRGSRDPILARAASFAVCAALRRHGLFELHAAGMVHPDTETGFLIIGPSGSGKSTLALQLARAGWPYLSDDELLLSLVEGAVEARGFRSFFAVKDEANGDFKNCFEPDSTRRVSAAPGVLLFISLEEKTRLARLTQAETMTRLLRACPWATYDTAIAAANLDLLSRLARQTRAFDLFASRDLLEPSFASQLFSSQHNAEASPTLRLNGTDGVQQRDER